MSPTILLTSGSLHSAWRHWGCATTKVFTNMKKSIEEAEDLDGFDDLNDEDKEKIRKAWEVGHVADEDIPDTARKTDDAGEEDDEDDEGKPKKKAAAKGAAKKDKPDEPGVFKFEYSSSGRAKCKGTHSCPHLMLYNALTLNLGCSGKDVSRWI